MPQPTSSASIVPWAGSDEIEDPVPGGALGGRANAVAEVLVELRRSPFPVGRDLLLDLVVSVGGHAMSLSLARVRAALRLRGWRSLRDTVRRWVSG